MLIGARIEGDELVIEVKELRGSVTEITRLPAQVSVLTPRISVSPDQEWVSIAFAFGGGYLLNLETLETVELAWTMDRPCGEVVARAWSGAETMLFTCGFSRPRRFIAGLDGVVREMVVPPDCEIFGHEYGNGLLFARCDEGDYVINARGDRLANIQSVPRLVVNDYNSLVVASENSVAAYVHEARGSRFWRWSEGAPEPGHFVPDLLVEDRPFWLAPLLVPGASVSLGTFPGHDDVRVYDPFNGTAQETCSHAERWLSFSPVPSHIMVSCPDITTYLNVATGAAETIPTTERFTAVFSRDATRFIRPTFSVETSFSVYDRSLRQWIDRWPAMSDVTWLYSSP